jgi:hypothetical protein
LTLDGATLSVGAADGGAGDDDGGRATVIADGKAEPVLEERRLVGTEHLADVGGVVAGDVEVGVVTDLAGKKHLDILLGDESGRLEGFVVLESRIATFLLEEVSDGGADGLPVVEALRHVVVQERCLEGIADSLVLESDAERRIGGGGECLEGESEVTDCDDDVVDTIGELGKTIWQVLDGELMTSRIRNPRHFLYIFFTFLFFFFKKARKLNLFFEKSLV